MPVDLEVNQLRHFLAVAEEGGFTRAAALLRVAQPSVSAQIRRLEARLGQPLFHRGPEGATLTQAGEVLLPWARRILGDVGDAVAQVRELDALTRGRLALGATPSLSTVLVAPLLSVYLAARPG